MIAGGNTTKSINQAKPSEEKAYDLDTIPLLDLDDPLFPSQIVQTFKNIGFVMVRNHGISPG